MSYGNNGPRLLSGVIRRTLVVAVGAMVALGLVSNQPVRAQSTVGTILGTVTDPSGAAIPYAKVNVTNTDTGAIRKVESDGAGNYQVPDLLPGNYTITAEQTGFQRAVVSGVRLLVDQRARYDLQLQVGKMAQQVEVSASGVAKLQTDDATLGQVVGDREIQDLPLNGRNFMQLLTLGAGAAPLVNSGPGTPLVSDTGRSGLSFTVSGGQTVSTNYYVDGVRDIFHFDMVPAWLPSLDFIQEFKVQMNAFSAEFGGAPEVVNIATKSGTNKLHGSAFEYVRNSAFDATQIQDPIVNDSRQISPYHQNQFGGSVGGPIVLPFIFNGKNRAFWFFNYEGYRSHRFEEFIGETIPTAERTGDFSNRRDANGNVIPIYDPATYNPSTGQRQQFPGNVIPTNRLSPMAQKMLSLIPLPTLATTNVTQNNISAGASQVLDSDQYNGRIDYTLSNKTSVFGRVSWFNSPFIYPAGPTALDSTSRPIDDRNAVIAVTHVFSPTIINEFRLGWNEEIFNVAPYNPTGENYDITLGIMGLSPHVVQYGPPTLAGTTFSVGPPAWDVVSLGDLFQYHDTLTMVRGKHTIKVGGDILDERPYILAEDEAKRGDFNFIPEFTTQLQNGAVVADTGADVADFLLGYPSSVQGQTGSSYTKFRYTDYHVFVLDDIKVTRNFMLSLGFRYEYNMHYKPEDDDTEGFCRTCYQDGEPGMLVQSKFGQVRSQIVDPDFRQVGPRVGFAWTPFGMKNTVLRAGWGTFYDRNKADELNFTEYTDDKTALDSFENTNPTPTFTLDQLFPVQPPGPNLSPLTTTLTDKWPQVRQWNVNVQHKFGTNWMFEIGYVGSHGRNLDERWGVNQASLSPNPLSPTPIQSRRPYPLYGDLLISDNPPFSISNYNSLQTKLEKTFTHGFNLLAAYTFSRCESEYNASMGATDVQNAADPQADYGLCGYQIKNRFNVSGVWYIPSGRQGFMGAVTKNWQLNGILQMQSGTPIRSPYVPGDWANVGSTWYQERMNRVCDGNLSASQRSVTQWFNKSCFVTPQEGTFGNGGQDVLIGPGYNALDTSLFRNFHLTEGTILQFRWEVFNALNNGNYLLPTGNSGSASYAKIISENDKRELQFSLRLVF